MERSSASQHVAFFIAALAFFARMTSSAARQEGNCGITNSFRLRKRITKSMTMEDMACMLTDDAEGLQALTQTVPGTSG